MIQFSVVLPVRNGWPYVQECVESILAQSYPFFDLIVLDNQSTDNTVPWLKSLSDSRIRLYTSSSALSIVDSWARITGVKKLEYMTMIGHDDTLEHEFLGTIKGLIETHPDASLYQTGSRRIDSQGRKIRASKPILYLETAADYLQGRFTYRRDISGTGIVMRSAEYDRLGGIPHFERLFFADDALWLSLMLGGFKVCAPDDLFSIRMHGKKESTTQPAVWSSILLGVNQFAEFLQSYVERDAATRSAAMKWGPGFMLRYHRNIYILALVEACLMGRTIDPAITEQIEASLAKCAPPVAGSLRHSPKVATIETLNASFLRTSVPNLWNVYHRFWMKAR